MFVSGARMRLLAMVVMGLVLAGVVVGILRAGGDGGSGGLGVDALVGLEDVGCVGPSGCPEDVLERWVMAAWLGEVMDVRAEPPHGRFVDAGSDVWWVSYVEGLAELGVVDGCGDRPLRFCPEHPVSRGQMATVLVRAFGLESGPSAGFSDMEGNVHAAGADALAAVGMAPGCGGGAVSVPTSW